MLQACLLFPRPFSNPESCTKALIQAEKDIETKLEAQVNNLLDLLRGRLNYKGVIVWTLYAPFFSLAPDPCNSQDWCFVLEANCMKPTVELRTEFNRLVTKTNDKLISLFTAYKKQHEFNQLQWADWSGLVTTSHGQFCEGDGAADVNDESNDKLAFTRFNLNDKVPIGDLRKRETG